MSLKPNYDNVIVGVVRNSTYRFAAAFIPFLFGIGVIDIFGKPSFIFHAYVHIL